MFVGCRCHKYIWHPRKQRPCRKDCDRIARSALKYNETYVYMGSNWLHVFWINKQIPKKQVLVIRLITFQNTLNQTTVTFLLITWLHSHNSNKLFIMYWVSLILIFHCLNVPFWNSLLLKYIQWTLTQCKCFIVIVSTLKWFIFILLFYSLIVAYYKLTNHLHLWNLDVMWCLKRFMLLITINVIYMYFSLYFYISIVQYYPI